MKQVNIITDKAISDVDKILSLIIMVLVAIF